MIRKYIGKTGKREVKQCNNCKNYFETLSVKVRAGGEKFCSRECYFKSRKISVGESKFKNRLYQKKYKYGLVKNDYLTLIEGNNHCEICNNVFKQDIKYGGPCIDHCHKSGNLRGVLCHTCNRGLGIFKDSVDIMQNAIKYLIKYK